MRRDKYELGKEIGVDLNEDGIEERIYYGLDDFRINDFWKIGELDNISETEVFDNLCLAD